MSKNTHQVVSITKDGIWVILTKPTTKYKADKFKKLTTPVKGEKLAVKTVKQVKKHKNVLGEEYVGNWAVYVRKLSDASWEELHDNLSEDQANKKAVELVRSGKYHEVKSEMALPFEEGGEVSDKEFMEYLDEIGEGYDYESDEWIIGGENRAPEWYGSYGLALKKFDPIAYEVAKKEYEQNYYKKGGKVKRSKKAIATDKSIKALHAGKRESESGNTYYENRENRSDKDRRKKLEKGGGVWFLKGVGKAGLNKIKQYSKENKNKLFVVTDDNHSNIGWFWLKDGKFAKKTVDNPNYDFAKNKTSLRPKSDVIYMVRELKSELEKGGKLPSIENVEYYPFMKKETYEVGDLVVRRDKNGEYTILDKVVGQTEDMGFTYYVLQSGAELMADDMVPAKEINTKSDISNWEDKLLSDSGKKMSTERKINHIKWQLQNDTERLNNLIKSKKQISSKPKNYKEEGKEGRTKQQILNDFDSHIQDYQQKVDYKKAVLESLKSINNATKKADGGQLNDNEHTYMLLSRMAMDNDYFLGAGNGYEKHLYSGSVKEQIKDMKELWNKLPKNEKPEWLSMQDILDYEEKMLEKLKSSKKANEETSFRYKVLIEKTDNEGNHKQPNVYWKGNDKAKISKMVKAAQSDFPKHRVFVTDEVEDKEIFNYETGGGINQDWSTNPNGTKYNLENGGKIATEFFTDGGLGQKYIENNQFNKERFKKDMKNRLSKGDASVAKHSQKTASTIKHWARELGMKYGKYLDGEIIEDTLFIEDSANRAQSLFELHNPEEPIHLKFARQNYEQLKNNADWKKVDTYKGYEIYQSKNDGDFLTVSPAPEYTQFLVGLDDSKLSGKRKMAKTNISDAKKYIDWVTRSKKAKGGEIYVAPHKKAHFSWIMTNYGFVIPNREDENYTMNDFAKDIAKTHSIENPRNKDAYNYVKQFGDIRPFNPKDMDIFEKKLSEIEVNYAKGGELENGGEIEQKYIDKALKLIDIDDSFAHDVAMENGQMLDNVKHMNWFIETLAERIKEQQQKYGENYAKGGSVGLDNIEATKSHLGISDEEWNKMSDDEKTDARRTSYKHLMKGKSIIKKQSAQQESKIFTGYLDFLNW